MEVQWLLCVAKEFSSKTIPTSLAYNNYAHNVYSMPNLKRAYLSHALADFKNFNTKILLFGPGFLIFTLNPTFVKLKNRAEVPTSSGAVCRLIDYNLSIGWQCSRLQVTGV